MSSTAICAALRLARIPRRLRGSDRGRADRDATNVARHRRLSGGDLFGDDCLPQSRTGAARRDAAAMTRANIHGTQLFCRRGKTAQEVDLPFAPELARELAHLPPYQMMLLAHGVQAKGYTADSLGNWFHDMCLGHVFGSGPASLFGSRLRKCGVRWLAEAGATENELARFSRMRTRVRHRATRQLRTAPS